MTGASGRPRRRSPKYQYVYGFAAIVIGGLTYRGDGVDERPVLRNLAAWIAAFYALKSDMQPCKTG